MTTGPNLATGGASNDRPNTTLACPNPACGAANPPGSRYCGYCAAALLTAAGTPVAAPPSPEQRYLTFHYPEIKDLAKHFLTLISGTLVLSATFAEKSVDWGQWHWAGITQKFVLVTAWALLVFALGACGLGLHRAFLAAEQADGCLLHDNGSDFRDWGRKAAVWLDVACVGFGAGVCLLVVTACLKMGY